MSHSNVAEHFNRPGSFVIFDNAPDVTMQKLPRVMSSAQVKDKVLAFMNKMVGKINGLAGFGKMGIGKGKGKWAWKWKWSDVDWKKSEAGKKG
jgi:hypothetical protein